MSALSIILRRQGRFDEALPLSEKTVALELRNLGEDHPAYWTSVGNLGAILTNLGEHDRAVALQRGRLDFRRRVLGEKAERTGDTWPRLGTALLEAGRMEEAETAYRNADRILRETSPVYDDNYTIPLYFSRLYLGMGDLERADALANESLQSMRRQDVIDPVTSARLLQIRAQIRLESHREREGCDLMGEARQQAANAGSRLRIEPSGRIALTGMVCDLLYPDPARPVSMDALAALGTPIMLSRDPGIVRQRERIQQLLSSSD